MSNELGMPLVIGVIAFLVGWILAKLAGLAGKRGAAVETPGEHHQIRSLEASLRIAQKKAADVSAQFESTCVDFTALQEAHEVLEAEVEERAAALDDAREAIRDETRKVHELRRELTDRAAAKIRAEVKAKDFETELDVMQAGSNAMKDEVDRLAAEHQDLSDRLHAATGTFDQQLVEDEDDRSSEEFLSDC